MMKSALPLIALTFAVPALADDTRQLDAHEHGVGTLKIAIDGTTVAMEFEAPGADIVGFEYAAESEKDLAAIDAAIATLKSPLELFALPDAAACTLVEAKAALESDDLHDENGHDDHAEDGDHGHDDHADDHDHDKHGEDEHAEHSEEAGHSEFHAEYRLNCENPDGLIEIAFEYFKTFPNAQEVEVQVISSSGAQAFEVERDAPVLNLGR